MHTFHPVVKFSEGRCDKTFCNVMQCNLPLVSSPAVPGQNFLLLGVFSLQSVDESEAQMVVQSPKAKTPWKQFR